MCLCIVFLSPVRAKKRRITVIREKREEESGISAAWVAGNGLYGNEFIQRRRCTADIGGIEGNGLNGSPH